MIKITNAVKQQADKIARYIMLAMNHECCKNFAGSTHTLGDFHNMMTRLVAREDSQYSYKNTLVALDEDSENVIGICVSYDGADLHRLRKAFIEEAIKEFGIDYSGIDDETEKGELYIDSLAVDERYRNMGIASALLKATCEKADSLKIPSAGLLVDCGNPKAELLYRKLGFKYLNDTAWGGHKMKHLQKTNH
ncbi:GNAT family N-acetyltransferase [Prevotella sp.]|uniref:GNAT family N-acetyltransferase n=1 Tax=Prevotella sp. TaxID=59823 RepID=UPI0026499C04|nr:GNAT family N-acetyltransferase [Prevotella sp.]MDN5554287.1 GNAT family N-acetyltransferase [Prevotella sp.]